MNAYELAEQIGKHAQLLDNLTDFPKGVKDLRDSANMLRQQADEKAELTGKFVKLADENNHLKDRIAELEKKELTDEEYAGIGLHLFRIGEATSIKDGIRLVKLIVELTNIRKEKEK